MSNSTTARLTAVVALTAAFLASCGGGGSNTGGFAQCGNGRIDAGELCDDGNTDDTDACTAICQPARCGDAVVQAGVEQCDGINLNGATCATLNRVGGRISCSTSCQYDLSVCGATYTATPVPTETPVESPVPTPTATPNPCGNGLLEPGEICVACVPDQPCSCETCLVCPDDCQVLPCTPGPPIQQFQVDLQPPLGSNPSTVSVLVAYRSDRVSLPSPGAGSRVKNRPMGSSQLVNNLMYAVRVVISAQAGSALADGELFTVDFDSCADSAPVTAADFACTVESCGSSGGPIEGCTCSVTVP